MSIADHQHMLEMINAKDMEQLIEETIPKGIRLKCDLNIPDAPTEEEFLAEFRKIALKNKVYTSYIGQGYYDTFTNGYSKKYFRKSGLVYRLYSISGRNCTRPDGSAHQLSNYGHDLTGMELANASLLDEATAAAEAMTMLMDKEKEVRKNS